MNTQVISVPVGSRGFDCVTQLTAKSADALGAAGFSFCIRYLGGLSAAELEVILQAHLGVMLVTYSKAPGWLPSASLGTSEGQTDLVHLRTVGATPGVTVFIDLEGCAGNAADTAAWVEARALVLSNSGYIVGLYVGAGCVLNSQQLFALKHVTRYWRSCSRVPEPDCGFVMMQLTPPNLPVAGVNVDIDVTQHDYENRAPSMMIGV